MFGLYLCHQDGFGESPKFTRKSFISFRFSILLPWTCIPSLSSLSLIHFCSYNIHSIPNNGTLGFSFLNWTCQMLAYSIFSKKTHYPSHYFLKSSSVLNSSSYFLLAFYCWFPKLNHVVHVFLIIFKNKNI